MNVAPTTSIEEAGFEVLKCDDAMDARALELNVVAEGVENEAQFLFLGENECDEVQGYLFGRPIPAVEISKVLAAR